MNFSENLRNIRTTRKLSQEQLAELIGVSRQAVSKWEQGNGYPETEKVIQIAQALNVSTDYLLLGKDNEPTVPAPKATKAAFSGDKKIVIQSYDGRTMSAFYKVTISPLAFRGKDEPKCILCGTDKTTWLGDNLVPLGWYATIDDAQREIADISAAIQNGETTYQLKYNAEVKETMFNAKLVSK